MACTNPPPSPRWFKLRTRTLTLIIHGLYSLHNVLELYVAHYSTSAHSCKYAPAFLHPCQMSTTMRIHNDLSSLAREQEKRGGTLTVISKAGVILPLCSSHTSSLHQSSSCCISSRATSLTKWCSDGLPKTWTQHGYDEEWRWLKQSQGFEISRITVCLILGPLILIPCLWLWFVTLILYPITLVHHFAFTTSIIHSSCTFLVLSWVFLIKLDVFCKNIYCLQESIALSF